MNLYISGLNIFCTVVIYYIGWHKFYDLYSPLPHLPVFISNNSNLYIENSVNKYWIEYWILNWSIGYRKKSGQSSFVIVSNSQIKTETEWLKFSNTGN